MTSRARAAIAIAAVTLTACGAPAPHAPSTAAKPPPSGLSGVVLDDQGAPVARTRVSCWIPDGASASTVSDDHGRFAFDLAPGHYFLRADPSRTSDPIAVTIDRGRRLDGVTLKMPPLVFEFDSGNFF